MSRILASVLVVALPSIRLQLAAQAPATAPTRSAIQQAVRAFVDASNKGDASALAELYGREPGVMAIYDGEMARGWDAIRSQADTIVSSDGDYQLTLGSIDVTPLGPTYALAVARFNMNLRTEQGEEYFHGALSLLLKRLGGAWKIMHSHLSTQGFAGLEVPDLSAPGLPETAYVDAMKSDLRNLVIAEEAFFADSVRYTSKIGRGGLSFSVSPGNTLPLIRVTRDGWTATIGNGNTRTRCAIFVGTTPIAPAAKEGTPTCS